MSDQRTTFKPSPELFPFQSRWFDSPVGPVHYVDEGGGQPILLLHGNPTWSFLYRKMIPELRTRGFRCLALDYPGYGLSVHPDRFGYTAAEQAEIVLAFMRHMDLRGVLVMGQDWGGPIGLCAAAREPERIAGLILGSTFGWPMKNPVMRFLAGILRSRFVQRYIVEKDHFVERVIRWLIRVKISKKELEHYSSVAPRPEFRRGMAELPKQLLDAEPWLVQLERDTRERLAEKPVLLLLGSKERVLGTYLIVRPFQKIFADAAVVELPGAGHFIQEDAPSEIVLAICARFGVQHVA